MLVSYKLRTFSNVPQLNTDCALPATQYDVPHLGV